MKIEHILLTTDLSPESLRPCLMAAELAAILGARITLFHVVQDLMVVPHGVPMAPPVAPIDIKKEVERAEAALAEQAPTLGRGVTVSTAVVTAARVHEAVVDYAKRHAIDLIALSTHGRTGFRHLALGSVAEAVLRHSPVPVLCFPR